MRRLAVLSVEQLAIAAALIFSGGILMLLLGTQILEWYWLALLGAIGAGIAAVRVRSRVFGRYRVAQLLDRKLELGDSLSTAWFLLSRPGGLDDPAVRFQIAYAERMAAGVYPASALPLTGRRMWALAGGLAAVTFGLFAVRYLVTNSLSLQHALIPLRHGAFFAAEQRSPAAKSPSLENPVKSDRAKEQALPIANAPRTGREDQYSSNESKTGLATPEQPAPQSQPQATNRSPDPSRETRAGDTPAAQARPGEQGDPSSERTAARQSAEHGQNGSGQPNANGLMDRMKDAFSSLMAKMRPSGNGPKSQQDAQKSADGQQALDKASANNDPNGDAQKDAGNRQASQDQSTDGQPQGETTEKTQASQGRNSNQPSDKKGSESQSGVGRQDGDKDVRDSEQLKAMGKLAEILGKRSAAVTGDIVVENPSGKQNLKTEYSQRLGQHADLGGEINRDEVPLMYQQYVREYMEQIHKQAKRQ
jgi:hypothetical protein